MIAIEKGQKIRFASPVCPVSHESHESLVAWEDVSLSRNGGSQVPKT